MKASAFEVVQKNIHDLVLTYKTIFVAFSGGVDSHVLLHLLWNECQSHPKTKLYAIYVNHNLSLNAKKWSRHCEKICKKLEVKYLTRTITKKIKSKEHSLEELLRNLRYEIFAKILPKGAVILTAHNANDQAETLLLQLFRGAGPKGLSAMPMKSSIAQGWLIRPLLDYSRDEILSYAKKHRLKWIEDESNANPKFDRNFIRHRLLPIIRQKWPAIITTLNRVSRHCAEASELLEIQAKHDLKKLINAAKPSILNISNLKTFGLSKQKNILRHWLYNLDLPLPSEVKLLEIIRTVINSRYDAMPIVKWYGGEVRRYRNNIYAMPSLPSQKISKAEIARKLKLDPKKITIKFRQGGEKIKLPGRIGTRDLKKVMQEWGIPPWERNRVPLVYYQKKLVAVIVYTERLQTSG